MKIKSLHLSYLRNNDHFQFLTGFKELIEHLSESMLKIETPFKTFLHNYNKENEMLEQIHSRNITDDLVEADNNREFTLNAMSDVITSSTKHFRPEVRLSANHLNSLFEQYKSLSFKSYDDQTAATNKLVEDLVGKHASDLASVGLSEWVSELKIKNLVFDSLKKSRYTELTSQMQLVMKHVRSEADATYYSLADRINALIELEGEEPYHHLVMEINAKIDSYNEQLSQRKSRTRLPNQAPQQPVDVDKPLNL